MERSVPRSRGAEPGPGTSVAGAGRARERVRGGEAEEVNGGCRQTALAVTAKTLLLLRMEWELIARSRRGQPRDLTSIFKDHGGCCMRLERGRG